MPSLLDVLLWAIGVKSLRDIDRFDSASESAVSCIRRKAGLRNLLLTTMTYQWQDALRGGGGISHFEYRLLALRTHML